jgi:hypothetical protein
MDAFLDGDDTSCVSIICDLVKVVLTVKVPANARLDGKR